MPGTDTVTVWVAPQTGTAMTHRTSTEGETGQVLRRLVRGGFIIGPTYASPTALPTSRVTLLPSLFPESRGMENGFESLTIRALARAGDVNVETIRFYQRKGLL